MRMKQISVPDFVADDFEQSLTHPSSRPNAVERSVERVYRLVNEALSGIEWPNWDVGQRRYHSPSDNEPLCFSQIGDKFYIWGEERGTKLSMAVFKSDHLAAKYFVWLVSNGERQINWKLFLDMEL